MRELTLGSLFDGISAFPLAASRFGIKTLWASEVEQMPMAVSRRHFPEMLHLGDIREVHGGEVEPVDIITFGSPCQDLSTTGKRAGLDGSRSLLFFEAVRVIDQMLQSTAGKYPRFAIWENVRGALSSSKGRDFATVIESLAGSSVSVPPNGWTNAGIAFGPKAQVAWRILDAQFFGVAQRRSRIFLVCDFGGESAGEILFDEKSLPWHHQTCREAGQKATEDAESGAEVASRTYSIRTAQSGSNGWGITEEVSHTLDLANGQAVCPAFKQGNSATAYSIGYEVEKSPTLTSGQSGKNLVPAVFHPIAFNGRQDPVSGEIAGSLDSTSPQAQCVCLSDQGGGYMDVAQDLAPTLRAQTHGNNPCVVVRRLYDMTHAEEVGGDCGGGRETLVAQCVTTGTGRRYDRETETLIPTLYDPKDLGRRPATFEDCSPTLKARGGTGGNDVPTTVGYAVRRLMPIETERLMAFPDNWTEWGAKEEVKRVNLSDTARYKAIGNSIAVCCLDWLFSQLAGVMQTEHERKMRHPKNCGVNWKSTG